MKDKRNRLLETFNEWSERFATSAFYFVAVDRAGRYFFGNYACDLRSLKKRSGGCGQRKVFSVGAACRTRQLGEVRTGEPVFFWHLDRQLRTTLLASTAQYVAARSTGRARSESMRFCSFALLWLPISFHNEHYTRIPKLIQPFRPRGGFAEPRAADRKTTTSCSSGD